MVHARPTGTSEDGSFYQETDISKVNNNDEAYTSLKLMPPGHVYLHVKPDPPQQYHGDDTPIMRMPDDNGRVVFCCKHIIQKADAKSGKEEKIIL